MMRWFPDGASDVVCSDLEKRAIKWINWIKWAKLWYVDGKLKHEANVQMTHIKGGTEEINWWWGDKTT